MILRFHTFFKPIAPKGTACGDQMGTGSAHRVRGIHDFNPLLGMLDQVTVNSSQVVNKGGAIPFASKSLETEERVGSQPNVCGTPLTDGIFCHDVSPHVLAQSGAAVIHGRCAEIVSTRRCEVKTLLK